jgi:hypothetical protein
MKSAVLILTFLLFLQQNLWADNLNDKETSERKNKFVLSLRDEPLFAAGANLELGGIISKKIYMTVEAGGGASFGFYAGAGAVAGRYFELGNDKKTVKMVPGVLVGRWIYIFDACWGYGIRKNNTYCYGGPFFKFLLGGKRFNLDISTRGMLGYNHYIYDAKETYKNEKTFLVYPSMQIGVAWIL